MSRKTREGERLAQDLARVIASGSSTPDRRLTKAQALKIKQEDARLLEERRANSMRRLLLKQYAPWIVAASVFVVGAICWLLRWIYSPLTAVSLAVLVAAAGCWAAWMIGRRAKKWRTRVHWAAGVGSSWLIWTAGTGPSWRAALVLVLGTVLVAGRWWQANRIPIPKKPNRGTVPVPEDQSIPVLWELNLGGQGCVLAGAALTAYDDEPKSGCDTHRINLKPGKQTITWALSQLEIIAGGLLTPVERVLLEPDPDRNPIHVKLTIVEHSPIEETVPYRGARLVGDHRNLIEVGPYGDGDGYANWRMWAPGAKPMTGSWLSGLIIAGTGIGKSRLMELLAAGYMASGNAVVWFIDPQLGASSPDLQEYADWYVSGEGTAKMLTALELIAAAREKENSAKRWTRFDPSPERPGIVVFMDEFHRTVERYANRLEDLARTTQKTGISIVGLTQDASLESLGKNTLRASMLANLIVMKTGMNTTKNLIPGLTVDPELLPKIPGYLYTIGERTAPGRAEYVEDPALWFKQYPMPKLDALSANAAGDLYGMRREETAAELEANRQWVEQMSSEGFQPELPEPDLDDWKPEPAEPRAFEVVQFPSAVAPPEKPARERVLVAVAQGTTRTREIGIAVGLEKTQLHDVLKELLEAGELERPTAGVYQIAGVVSQPER